MIICHDLKLIFVKTKKVAGTSFEIALSKYCDEDDIITPISPVDERSRAALGFQGPVNYTSQSRLKYRSGSHPNREISGDFVNHMTSRDIGKNVGEALFNSYTTVSIQRDPLDFLISQFYFRNRNKTEQDSVPFRAWLETNYENIEENYRISPSAGHHAVDIVLKFETLINDISRASLLPTGFTTEFEKLRAKGDIRDEKSRDVIGFFETQGCEDYIEKIRALTT